MKTHRPLEPKTAVVRRPASLIARKAAARMMVKTGLRVGAAAQEEHYKRAG